MRELTSIFVLIFLTLPLSVHGCGSSVGNPEKPKPVDADNKPSRVALPRIDLEFPPSLLDAESSLQLLQSKTVTEGTISILDGTTRRINDEIDQFTDEGGYAELGPFSRETQTGLTEGVVSEIEDKEYDYQVVFCRNEKPFFLLKWSSEQNKIYATRSGKTQTNVEGAPVELTVEKNGLAASYLFMAEGKIDDQRFSNSTKLTTKDGQMYQAKSVIDRYSALPVPSVFKADIYNSFTFDKAGQGDNLIYNRLNPFCDGFMFEEDSESLWKAGDKLGFCFVGPLGGSSLQGDSQQPVLDRMKAVGIRSSSELEEVDFPSDLSCQ